MSRIVKIEINETQAQLQELLRKQKTGSAKERVQALHLLKTRQVETVKHLYRIPIKNALPHQPQ